MKTSLVENLIKGAYIAQTPHLSIEQRFREWQRNGGGHGHGLSRLAGLVTTVSAEEEELLKRLEAFAVWAGRYPTSKTSAGYAIANNEAWLTFKMPDDEILLKAISERLLDIIESSTEPSG